MILISISFNAIDRISNILASWLRQGPKSVIKDDANPYGSFSAAGMPIDSRLAQQEVRPAYQSQGNVKSKIGRPVERLDVSRVRIVRIAMAILLPVLMVCPCLHR